MPRYIDADRIDMNQVKVFDYKEQKWVLISEIPTVTEEELQKQTIEEALEELRIG